MSATGDDMTPYRLRPLTGYVWHTIPYALADVFAHGSGHERLWIVAVPDRGGFLACVEAADGTITTPGVCGILQLVTERGGFTEPEWQVRLGPGVVDEEECQWPMLHEVK